MQGVNFTDFIIKSNISQDSYYIFPQTLIGKMCKKKAEDSCQTCQEQVAVESLLSISRSSKAEVNSPPTPPPSDAGSMSPQHCEDSMESMDTLKVKHNGSSQKRSSKLAQVSYKVYLQILKEVNL